ncbi:MAG: hypothetical protein BHW65_03090 [Verrucomicrobia bacterium CAG:312_58_20]|nr:MAG: hypothetical protein BHW65_03090 [Verrucomicrobia bacterium CAG:312_58_20]PWL66477.1 MAG: hypothetical protein DBY30_05105 [Verrucomicrobiota bacterium]
MKQTKNIAAAALRAIAGARRGGPAFCNIAEGTHAGSVTMRAAEAVDSQNLLVAAGENDGEFVVASASKKPIGVCLDEGAKGDSVSVALPGCAESTFVCRTSANVSAGDSLYASAGGKVSPVAGDGAYKVGVALCSAAAGCPVEIDPQGFGERAWQVHSCGLYVWTGATSSETLASGELGEGDIAFASIAAAGGSEKSVSAIVSDGGITFSLDAAGTASSTKIAWMVLRKN